MPESDPASIEKKWQARWRAAGAFEPSPEPGRPKFFGTFPYPYVNGLPHVGHLFTMMRVEAFARYHRSTGHNVLFPQAWHCTGQPIVNAAKRVAEGEEKQIQILKDFGVPADQIPRFTEPEHWIHYFVPGYRADVQALGMSIDWRREFITTSLNPHYDRFIRWQLRTLRKKGYVEQGKHPVVWCPKDLAAVGDHGRVSGEGETTQEFVVVLFPLVDGEGTLACATLRPETLPGLTNLWVNPALTYVRADVDGQEWLVSKPCAEKLLAQDHQVTVRGEVSGESLIGKLVRTPDGTPIPVLPAKFPTPDKGTGIVMSVPSDSPDDYIGLRDLQRDAAAQKRYGLSLEHIKPIPIIDTPELGDLAAVKAVEQRGIKHQGEREKLEEAKKLVYKKGFYDGTMVAGPYQGERVETAKENVKRDLLLTKQAILLYELTGPVVCRCLTACIAKVVENQWFINYNDADWKAKTHKALDRMRLYPEKARSQFEYVIDWLREWACTREEGLGTRLPWDEHWLIESLSDSTLYNAYYTVSHHVQSLPIEHVDDAFFDYVFLGVGEPRPGWETLRKEFLYWYPVDFRNSGKDLIQNHLTFMLFTHVAIFPEELWPQGYGLNGWVTVDGQKMSKSLGNLIPVRAMLEQYGADASRLTILNGGEGLDDPNWDTELAKATRQRLAQLLELCSEWHGKGRAETEPLDEWLESKLHSTVRRCTEAMEETNFRTAIQVGWFEFGNILRQYLKLTGGKPHRELFSAAIKAQLLLLQPFTPHTCEEGWERIGGEGLISHAAWPTFEESKIRPELEAAQDLIESVASDIQTVQRLLKRDHTHSITLIVSPAWKYELVRAVRAALEHTRNPGEIIKSLAASPLRPHGQEIAKLVPVLVREPGRLFGADLSQELEERNLRAATGYLHHRFGAPVTVQTAEESTEGKAKQAFPGKPAIVLA